MLKLAIIASFAEMSGIDKFVEELELVQRNYGLTHNEKENSIHALFVSQQGTQTIGNYLAAVLTRVEGKRIIQIVEQYPKVYENLLDDPALAHLLHNLNLTTDTQIIRNLISMVSVALQLYAEAHKLYSDEVASSMVVFGLQWVKFEDLAISERSSELLLAITRSFAASPTRMSELMGEIFDKAQAIRDDTTLLLRYLAIGATLSKDNQTAAHAFVESQLLTLLYELCRSKDILAAVNAIEFLADVAKGPGARAILAAMCEEVVPTTGDSSSPKLPAPMTWLSSLCPEESNPSFDPFLRDVAMRTLTELFAHAVESNFGFVDMDFDMLISTASACLADRGADAQTRLAGLAVISDLALVSSVWLRRVLFPDRDPSLETASAWFTLLHSGKPELASAGLFALAHVIARPDNLYVAAAQDSEHKSHREGVIPDDRAVTEMKKRLALAIGSTRSMTTIKYLLQVAKQPVSPLRIAAMEVMKALIQQQSWGLGSVLCPGLGTSGSPVTTSSLAQSEFLQYLLDRTTEYDKEGKDAKFQLIVGVRDNTAVFPLLSEDTQIAINRAISQGAYYMPPRLEEMQTL